MKSKKSKTSEPMVSQEVPKKTNIFFGKKKEEEHLSERELKLRKEELKRQRQERMITIRKAIGQFLVTVFVLLVIISMVAIPLLIVFG